MKSPAMYWRVTTKAMGVFLIVVGLVAFGFQGFRHLRPEKATDPPPVQSQQENKKHIPLGPAGGLVALLGGAVLLGISHRST